MRQHNTSGGGAKTNENGLRFERDKDVKMMMESAGYLTDNIHFCEKHGFSRYCKGLGFDVMSVWSKRLLPDECLIIGDTIYIVEKKYQQTAGSVDEKMQTCGFKKMQYEKVANAINMKVKFVYLFSDFFKDPRYKDALEYIEDMGCNYFFDEIPTSYFGM